MNNRKLLCTFLIAIILMSLIVPEISARQNTKKARKKGKQSKKKDKQSKNNDPIVNYIRAEGPGGRLDPAGTIGTGSRVRMYTKVIDAETASASLTVSISYRPQGGAWTTVAATYYSAPNKYWYVDWVIPGSADLGLYDVKVDVSDGNGGSTSVTELGEYEVVADANLDPVLGEVVADADPVVVFIQAEGPGGRLDPAGTIGTGSRVRMYTKVSDAETASDSLTVNISYRPQGGNWTNRVATYDAPNNYWYVDWMIPEGADLGLYDVKVDVSDGNGGSATATELGEYEVVADADPVVVFIQAEGPGGRLDPAGTIGTGSRVRMYTKVSDAETASDSLTVNISYRPQGGNWTNRVATYDAPNNYWYVDWMIPEGADLGLYDVKVDVSDGNGGSATATELGEYEVI